jgi:hypothetical protein
MSESAILDLLQELYRKYDNARARNAPLTELDAIQERIKTVKRRMGSVERCSFCAPVCEGRCQRTFNPEELWSNYQNRRMEGFESMLESAFPHTKEPEKPERHIRQGASGFEAMLEGARKGTEE